MSDQRPRPEYGEYATPEEVAEARGPVPLEETLAVRETPAASSPSAPAASRPSASPTLPPPVPGTQTSSTPPRHPSRWDLPLTVTFIALALVNTLSSIPSYLDLATALNEAGRVSGMGDLAFGPAASAGGIALLVIDAVILLATIGLAWRRFRAGKRAVWVPIIAFAVRLVAYVIVVMVIVLNTPGFSAIVENPPS